MKINDLKDMFFLLSAAGIAYFVSRDYRKKRKNAREAREFLHFQLF